MDLNVLIFKGLAGGVAATGFAILFNSERSALPAIFVFGLIGVLLKFGGMVGGMNIIATSFFGATMAGFLSYFLARRLRKPPLLLAIPSVIPMIPGIFLYRMMLGFIRLADKTELSSTEFVDLLYYTSSNGLKAFFILSALALGISLPYLLFRKATVYYLDD